MKKNIFLFVGVIFLNTLAMEQPSDTPTELQWQEGEIPTLQTAPDYMKYKAHCVKCNIAVESISSAALKSRFKQCTHEKIMDQHPLYYYCILLQCPECNAAFSHTGQYDAIRCKISMFANDHIRIKHHTTYPLKGSELYNQLIKSWKYVSEKPKIVRKKTAQKIVSYTNNKTNQDHEVEFGARLLCFIKSSNKRKRE